MATRYTANPQSRYNVPSLPTGYQSKSTSDVFIPAVGLEDVDKGLFDLFNTQIPMMVDTDEGDTKCVPVVFYAGEKWALSKKLRALRDRNGSLILPLITAVRTTVLQDSISDISGRGINQQTGEIVVHRRLDKSDRQYQNIINRLLLKHQSNLAVSLADADAGQLTTLRSIGDLSDDPVVKQGGVLIPDRLNNIYETIVVPAPQFFTAQYDFVFWAQYNKQMNQMLEALLASFLPQGNAWRLETPKGYWFIATVDANTYTADNNADDYSQEERIVRYKFSIKVPGYVLASNVPGAPVPIKRYVSSPIITFKTNIGNISAVAGPATVDDPFLGADDPTLPLTNDQSPQRDQRFVDGGLLYPGVGSSPSETGARDPALRALPRGTNPSQYQKITGVDRDGNTVTRLVKIKNVNAFSGETVLSPDDVLDGLTIVLTDG